MRVPGSSTEVTKQQQECSHEDYISAVAIAPIVEGLAFMIAGAAEDQLHIADRDLAERRKVLAIQIEAQVSGIEGDRARNIPDLVLDAPEPEHERLLLCRIRHDSHLATPLRALFVPSDAC